MGLAERTPRTEVEMQNNKSGISTTASSQPEAITKRSERTRREKQPNAEAVSKAARVFHWKKKKMQKMNKC